MVKDLPEDWQEAALEGACRQLIHAVGADMDMDEECLRNTPLRFARAWLDHWAAGYKGFDPTAMTTFAVPDNGKASELIFQGPIQFWSLCAHHIAPFFGSVYISYLPDEKIIGLSKLPRIVDVFSRRLQIQEKLTVQIATAITDVLNPLAVGVVVKARHSCMESRGVRRAGIWTTTSRLVGTMMQGAMRAEFFSMVAMSGQQE